MAAPRQKLNATWREADRDRALVVGCGALRSDSKVSGLAEAWFEEIE